MQYLYIIGFIILLFSACQPNTSTTAEQRSKAASTTEQHRPHYHFTPPAKWMNDPNGMVFYAGEYHLFYQYYPDSTVWGPMHWGHAVSRDLVSWEHLPIALYPDSLGYIFSGSAVVDWNNTSGFGTADNPPMVAIFTYHDPKGDAAGRNDFQYQGIAYSTDKGRNWTKYEGNPVVPNPGIRDFRDPKVIWDEDSDQWIMVFAAWDHVKFYGSPNLKDWTYLSDFGQNIGAHTGVWECPDLFPMTIASTGEQYWVLLQSLNPGAYNGGSGTQYFVGQFDGQTFTVDPTFAKALNTTPAYIPDGKVFEDFENGYGEWTAAGDAFGESPAQGTLQGQQEVQGYSGQSLVNSFLGGDKTSGKLTSPTFVIEQDYINFQIGGGNDKLRTAMNLLIDGKIERIASGGNSEQLQWKGWDVREFKGKTARLQIVDEHPGGWGHILVDQIVFADDLAKAETQNAVWLDYGRDNYAGVTWSDIPKEDGRRIFMGWMSNWDYAQVVPTQSWRSAMTLARNLQLQQTEAGPRLMTTFVKEMQQNRGTQTDLQPKKVAGELDITNEMEFEVAAMEAMLEWKIPEGSQANFGIELSNSKGERYRIGFDAAKNSFYSDRSKAGKQDFSADFAGVHYAPRLGFGNTISMHLFFDVASAEMTADQGATAITDIFFPNEDFNQLKLFSENGEVELSSSQFFEMKTAM